VELRDGRGRHEVVVAEGPERISGDWWRAPYAREYWWAGTGDGELLWLFREHRGGEDPRWRLHGWWD
jgi:protein ImuB